MTVSLTPLTQALVNAALVGVDRRAPTIPTLGGDLGALIHRIPADDPPQQVLALAGVTTLYRQAGAVPATLEGAGFAPAPPHDQPQCSAGATQLLQRVLHGEYRVLLDEWLALAQQAGQRAAPELLPDLLEFAARVIDLQPLVTPVLGARGRWLAAQNPAWQWVRLFQSTDQLLQDAAKLWEDAPFEERLVLLPRLRPVAPDQARDLLALTWATDPAPQRAKLLQTLATGLGPTDEAFLEAALDDRAKAVRQTAASLLAALPQSALTQRMIARTAPCLTLKKGARKRIEVELPEELTPEMQRDGIEPKPSRWKNVGDKAYWLQQMIESIPPSHWVAHWSLTPEQILDANRAKDWKTILLEGFRRAAIRHADPDWSLALIKHDPKHVDLLAFIRPADRDPLIIERLKADTRPLRGNHPALTMLRKLDSPWSHDLTRAVLARAQQHIKDANTGADYEFRTLLTAAGRLIDPALLPEVENQLRGKRRLTPAWETTVDELIALLDFRQKLHKEFAA